MDVCFQCGKYVPENHVCSSGSSACSGADARQADKADLLQELRKALEPMLHEVYELGRRAAVSPRSSDGNVPTPVIAKSDCTVRLHFDSTEEANEAFDKLVEWYGQANNTDESRDG